MLISHPNSTCDVCLEPYGSGSKAPHSISCGHVFCFSCLGSIPGTCPLCRDRFHPSDTRRLHIDMDTTGISKSIHTPPPEQCNEARKLQDSIARIVKDGSSESHLRALIEQCSTFLKTQDRGQHEDLRVSHRMISYLCDVKSSLKKQTESLTRIEADHDALRKHLATEREITEATERKYQELLQVSRDEKATALAVEKSLREHYEQIVEQYHGLEKECQKLSDEVNLLRCKMQTGLRPAEYRFIYTPSTDDHPTPTKDSSTLRGDLKGIRSFDKESFYLSPLPEQIRPLPTTLKSFSALPEVDYDDSDMEKGVDHKQKHPYSILRKVDFAAIEPLRNPTDLLHDTEPVMRTTTASSRVAHPQIGSHAPRVSSGLSLTAPRNYGEWCEDSEESVATGSDLHRGSGSPIRTPSNRSSPSRPTSADTHCSLDRHNTSSHDAQQRDRDRSRFYSSASAQPEQLRTQLHDLLDIHTSSSSLPNISHFPTARPSPSRSASFSSQGSFAGSSSSSTSGMAVKPSSTSHNSAAPAAQIISHASTAALALEAEKRRKAELERQRQLSDGSTSDPSRDTHNTPVGPRRASPNGGSEMITRPSRDANHGFGPSVSVGSSSSSLRDTYGSFTHRQLAMNLGNGKGKLASVNA